MSNTTPAFTSGGNVFQRIAAQWNAYFGAKVDATGGYSTGQTLSDPAITGGTITDAVISGNGVVTAATVPLLISGDTISLDITAPLEVSSSQLALHIDSSLAVPVTQLGLATAGANTVLGTIAPGQPAPIGKTTLTTLINAFTSALSGAVPASGGGTANFLRADGTWNVPALTPITASLGGNVALNNTANYFDGPSVAQGSISCFASGTVTVSGNTSDLLFLKLWDGTTVIASASLEITATGNVYTVSLSGFLAAPAGNIRISVRDSSSTSGSILYNASGNSKDSTITAIRIG